MTVILGIDPGSRKTGFGVIRISGAQTEYLTSGVIRLPDQPLPERLTVIFDSLSQIVSQYRPQQASVEQVFMAKNAASALKLGQARGAAIVACATQGIAVAEYSARQIKQSVVGTGAASKEQVQHMVRVLLGLPGCPQEDAADALAAAICHAHASASLQALPAALSLRRGRLR